MRIQNNAMEVECDMSALGPQMVVYGGSKTVRKKHRSLKAFNSRWC